MAQAGQKGGFLNNLSADSRRYVREIKNKVYNYTEMEQMVREATCNDSCPPNPALIREIAKGTFTVEFPSIMALIWKRIKDRSNENHPLKCLILIEFLLREGNADMVMKHIQKNLVFIEQLKHFTLYNEEQQDLGQKVRVKAESFLQYLKDGDQGEQQQSGRQQQQQAYFDDTPEPAFRREPEPEVDLLGGGGDPFGSSGGSGGGDPFGGGGGGFGGGGFDDGFGDGSGGGGPAFKIGEVPEHVANAPVMKLDGPAGGGPGGQ
mmetsp:Transcript_5785/g.15167  ORF Transcript_5785/g.15167 Transcript_5785/m.15167 type:complete len:263 (+) Transcript_5785:44-832(+)